MIFYENQRSIVDNENMDENVDCKTVCYHSALYDDSQTNNKYGDIIIVYLVRNNRNTFCTPLTFCARKKINNSHTPVYHFYPT